MQYQDLAESHPLMSCILSITEPTIAAVPGKHTDDTQTRVDGQNQHCHVLCNPVYTDYQILPKKDRLSVLDVLRHGRKRIFRLNREALDYLEHLPFSKENRQILLNWSSEQDLDETTFLACLDLLLPDLGAQHRMRKRDVSLGPRTQDGERAWDTFMFWLKPPKNWA